MPRPAGKHKEDKRVAIRRAAIRRMYRYGYEAMSLRALASDVDLRVGSLHNYIPQKQEFLANLLDEIMIELLSDFKRHMENVETPEKAIREFVRFHIEWHTARKEEVFIGNMELRSLSHEQYEKITQKRKEYELLLQNILKDGKNSGIWQIEYPEITAKALLALLTGISNWYKSDGSLSQKELTHLYQLMVERMLKGE